MVLGSRLADALEDPHVALDWEVNHGTPPPEDAALARAIAQAITEAPPDASEVAVPHYGRALRVRLPALALTGRRGDVTKLPPFDLWHVEDVAPPARHVHVARPRAAAAARSAPRPKSHPTPPVRPAAPAPAPTWQRAIAALLLVALVLAMAWALAHGRG